MQSYILRVGALRYCTEARNKREAVDNLFRAAVSPLMTKDEALKRIEPVQTAAQQWAEEWAGVLGHKG